MAKISLDFENPLKLRFGEEFFRQIPKDAGVYTFLDARGNPLYVGKADNLKRRLKSYVAAKPGQTAENILEMIEHAEKIRWEIHPSGDHAMKREAELIRSVRPRYNLALNWDVSYLYIGIRSGKTLKSTALVDMEFRLSHYPIDEEGFKSYGCFRHRGKIKSGYTALLRLLFAASCPRERFQLPAKLCRSAPPYQYKMQIPKEILKPLNRFLAGEDFSVLRLLVDHLLKKESLPKPLYIPLQRDFGIAKEFFAYGPEDTKSFAKKINARTPLVSQKEMDRVVRREFKAGLKEAQSAS